MVGILVAALSCLAFGFVVGMWVAMRLLPVTLARLSPEAMTGLARRVAQHREHA